ncbi:hypothetical protein CFP65_3428 [Kitasatospora sp. MMS16-BH015]|uniref:hypothetical protein n=1 Tax=Kitasatospora sp. MMS16-BH015 TaxID=2018025 RepID=UPI000CA106AA|nr:hypothetical protein [Kitasatospora sp. MMS16-BH015]AUG78224.1 hypothetical protein CFP65_3428 [Kitasatospora sp. MMS16-BH015]
MNKRLLTVPALGALLAFGAVACGSDNTAQLNSWATSVCGAAQSPIAKSRTALADTGAVKQGEGPADLQKRLATDLGILADTDQKLAEAIDKAGAPKIDQGAKLQQDAVGELKQTAQGYLDVQKKLTTLPSNDQARFADGLRSIGDQVQRLAQQSTDALGKLQSGDLATAMAKQPGCKSEHAISSASPAAGASAGGGATGSTATPGVPAASGAAGTPAAAPGTPAPGASTPAAPATPGSTAPLIPSSPAASPSQS